MTAVFQTNQVKKVQVRTGAVRTGQVRTGQIRTGQVKTGQVRTVQVRTGSIEFRLVKSSQVWSSPVNTGQGNFFIQFFLDIHFFKPKCFCTKFSFINNNFFFLNSWNNSFFTQNFVWTQGVFRTNEVKNSVYTKPKCT